MVRTPIFVPFRQPLDRGNARALVSDGVPGYKHMCGDGAPALLRGLGQFVS